MCPLLKLFSLCVVVTAIAGEVSTSKQFLQNYVKESKLRLEHPDLAKVLPPSSLTHFCVITNWDTYNSTLEQYATLLGEEAPAPGVVGGLPANGTYLGKRLIGTTKIAFLDLNNQTRIELLAGDPQEPSWWRDVYNIKGFEIHHMGYNITDEPLWDVVERFEAAGLGKPVQWARWGNEKGPNAPGSGCYVYLDSQLTLGVTTEVLSNGPHCDGLPNPSDPSDPSTSRPAHTSTMTLPSPMKMPAVSLGNAAKPGESYPVIGLGTGGYGSTYGQDPECWWDICGNGTLAEKAILDWLDVGGRRIDDATSYYHQKATGRALRATSVPRSEIYYVSKTGPTDPLGFDDVIAEAESIKEVVGLDYVDALLVHWPTGGQQGTIAGNVSSDPLCQTNNSLYDERECRLSTWRGMVHLFETGFAKAIGVSNYNETHLMEIVESGLPLPSITQLPYNPHRYKSHARMEQLCRSLGITINGYSPFGVVDLARGSGSRGGHSWPSSVGASSLLEETAVVAVAAKHNATPAQVLIAWSLKIGVPVNPRTYKKAHMRENLAAWKLNLSPSDVLSLSSLAESTCDIDPLWYECTPTSKTCPPQCCSTPPCPTDAQGNCCAGGGQ